VELHEPLIPIVDFIDVAINHGSNMHIDDNRPIRWAARYGHFDFLKKMIIIDPTIDLGNALHWACYNGNNEIIDFIKDRMPDPNI
jgi:ankyrin repeat protein